MKTIIQSKNAPCGLVSVLPLVAVLFATIVTPATAQLYVETINGSVEEYYATTGAPINIPLVPLFPGSTNSLALFGNNLFVAQTPRV